MSTISDVLDGKGADVYCIDPDATVFQAIGCMVEHNVGSLLVIENRHRGHALHIRGILTERDYLEKVAMLGRTSRNTRVGEIASRLRGVAGPEEDIDTCLTVMTQKRIRHLPVVRGGQILGIVSIGDLTKRKLADQRVELEHILGYLQGVPTESSFGSICYGRSKGIRESSRSSRRQSLGPEPANAGIATGRSATWAPR